MHVHAQVHIQWNVCFSSLPSRECEESHINDQNLNANRQIKNYLKKRTSETNEMPDAKHFM